MNSRLRCILNYHYSATSLGTRIIQTTSVYTRPIKNLYQDAAFKMTKATNMLEAEIAHGESGARGCGACLSISPLQGLVPGQFELQVFIPPCPLRQRGGGERGGGGIKIATDKNTHTKTVSPSL